MERAVADGKRILPVVIADVDSASVPAALSRLNFLFFTNCSFVDAVAQLDLSLSSDLNWLRQHTHLAGLAEAWENGDRNGQVLRGRALDEAEQWIAKTPANAGLATERHRNFIRSSRKAASNRQRNWIGGSIAIAVFSIGLALWGEKNRRDAALQALEAIRQKDIAQVRLVEVNEQKKTAETQRAAAVDGRKKVQRLLYASQNVIKGKNQLANKNVERAMSSALSALPFDPWSSNPEIPISNDATSLLMETVQLILPSQRIGKPFARTHTRTSSDTSIFSNGRNIVLEDNLADRAQILDVNDNTLVATLDLVGNNVSTVGFQSSAETIVVLSKQTNEDDDETVFSSWNSSSQKMAEILRLKNFSSYAVSNSSETFVATSYDGSFSIAHLRNGKPKVEIQTYHSLNDVAFSPNGNIFALAGRDGLELYSVTPELEKLDTPLEGMVDIHSVAFSPDGTMIMGSDRENIRIWNSSTGAVLNELAAASNADIEPVFSPDSKTLLTVSRLEGSKQASVEFWNVSTATRLETISLDSLVPKSVEFSSNNNLILINNSIGGFEIWDWRHATKLFTSAEVKSASIFAKFLLGEKRLAVLSTDGEFSEVVLDDLKSVIAAAHLANTDAIDNGIPKNKELEENDFQADFSDALLCDLLTADPLDAFRTVEAGVPFDAIDPSRAIPACQKAIMKSPTPRLQYQIARAYQVNKDWGDAQESLNLAARGGYPSAIGLMLDFGLIQQNKSDQENLLAKAFSAGSHSAGFRLASLACESSATGSLCIDLLNKSAELGSPEAHERLGSFYLEGSHVETDNRRALEHFAAAVQIMERAGMAQEAAKLRPIRAKLARQFPIAEAAAVWRTTLGMQGTWSKHVKDKLFDETIFQSYFRRQDDLEKLALENTPSLSGIEVSQLPRFTPKSDLVGLSLRAKADIWVKLEDEFGNNVASLLLGSEEYLLLPVVSKLHLTANDGGLLSYYLDGQACLPVGKSGDFILSVELPSANSLACQ